MITIVGKKVIISMWYQWSIWMEYSMEITGRTFQETIWIEFGDIQEEIIIVKFLPWRNFCILSTKPTLFLLLSISMGIVILWTHFSMEILSKERIVKTQNYFLTTVAEKSGKYRLVNQLSVFLKIKRLVQGLSSHKCFPKQWSIPSKILFTAGRKAKI